MNRDPFGKVFPGSRMRFPAQAWNRMLDAARSTGDSRFDGGAGGIPMRTVPPGCIMVRNDSGADRARFDVLAYGDLIIEPNSTGADPDINDAASAFFFQTPAVAASAIYDESQDRICILQEPIKSGDYGVAMIEGITYCKIYPSTPSSSNTYPGFMFARPSTGGNMPYRRSGGPIMVIASPKSGSRQWSLVSIRPKTYNEIILADSAVIHDGTDYNWTIPAGVFNVRIQATARGIEGQASGASCILSIPTEPGGVINVSSTAVGMGISATRNGSLFPIVSLGHAYNGHPGQGLLLDCNRSDRFIFNGQYGTRAMCAIGGWPSGAAYGGAEYGANALIVISRIM